VDEVPCVGLVLLGDNSDDIEGASELCASIFHYEPHSVHVLLVCDGDAALSQTMAITARFGDRLTAALAPPKHPVDARGDLGANVLYGLDLIESRFRGSFVLKLDADSLTIGPFFERIHQFLSLNAQCGVCGTLGRTNAREEETYGFERTKESSLVRMISSRPSAQWSLISSLPDSELLQYARNDPTIASSLRAYATIARPVQEALLCGYRWLEYCQGGGYAISWSFLKAMRSASYLAQARSLLSLPTGEDVLLSMYCRSLGFHVMDYSDNGQPFACKWRGLPYPPDVLIQRQHAIIHSLKGDGRASREQLQLTFKALRA
jgi:hypothetical protein